MSGIGSIIAAGVAPATQQAAQVAARRDKRLQQQQRAAQRTHDIFQAHLETLEENDETETQARLRPDGQMHLTEHPHDNKRLELARLYPNPRRHQAGQPSYHQIPGQPPEPPEAVGRLYAATGRPSPATDPSPPGQPHLDVEG